MSYPKLFLNQKSSVAELSPIGEVTKVVNDARVKKSFLFNWDDGFPGKSLSAGDMVFTNEGSKTRFKLKQGQEVGLYENTLLKIREETIEIKEGEVELTFGADAKTLAVMAGGQRFNLKASEESKVTIQSAGGKNSFQVASGKILIESKNIAAQASAGEELVVSGASASKNLAGLRPVFPVSETLALRPGETFAFKAPGAPKHSKARALNLGTKDNIILPLNEQVELAPGEYEWQVTLEDKALSRKALFGIVKKVDPPLLSYPEDLEEIVFYGEAAPVEFSWKGGTGELQVKDSEGNAVFSSFGESPKTAKFSKEGLYQWRAKISSQKEASDWSPFRKLLLTKLEYSKGEAVVIELKRPNQLASFEWKEQAPAGAVFKLSKTKDFTNVVHQQSAKGLNSIQTTVPEIGVYYWRIDAAKGSKTEFIPVKVLIRPVPPPKKPQPPPSLKLKLRPKKRSSASSFFSGFLVSNAWAESFEETILELPYTENAKLYEVEIFSDQKQQRLVETLAGTSPSFKWTPPRTGSYTYRYRYQDHWGRWSPFSDPSGLSAAIDSAFVSSSQKPKNSQKPKKPRSKRKLKKKKTKKAAPVIAKTQKKLKNILNFSYAPASVTYEKKDSAGSDNAKIDGAALGGHSLSYLKQARYPFELEYVSTYGKVFEEQDFALRSLKAALYKKFFKRLHVGPSLLWSSANDYAAVNGRVENKGSLSAFGLGLSAFSQMNVGALSSLIFEAGLHFLDVTGASVSVSHQYPLTKRIFLQTRLKAAFFSFEEEDFQIEGQSFQALIGPQYHF